jgi:hypothetical protein
LKLVTGAGCRSVRVEMVCTDTLEGALVKCELSWTGGTVSALRLACFAVGVAS